MEDSGDIVRFDTINQHHQEDGSGTDGGLVSLRHSLRTGAFTLLFSPEHHEQRPVV